MSETSDRYSGDGSAERERLTRSRDVDSSPKPNKPTKERLAQARKAAQEQHARCVEGFRASAQHAIEKNNTPSKRVWYLRQLEIWENFPGGESLLPALLEAAMLDGVSLENKE